MNILPSVLLVDDEESIRSALRRELQQEGYEIYEAGSASDALKLLKVHQVDLVLSDQRMPSMTGSELFDIVQRRYPQIVRLLLSGYCDFSALANAVNTGGISGFVYKPWNTEELRETIATALKKACNYRRLKQEASARLPFVPASLSVRL